MPNTLRDLVPEQSPEVLAKGFQFTEGPVWHPDRYLLFSDIAGDTIFRFVPGRGVQKFITPSRNSNGLTFDASGRLLACEHGGRQISRISDENNMVPLVGQYDGKPLNSPNDLVVHSSGNIFFTDPPFGISPDTGEQGFNGVYRVDPNGSITLLRDDMDLPNGLAFTSDESILYIADSRKRQVLAYPVNSDLSLGEPSVFVDMDVTATGNPDGIKVDVEDNVYIAGAGGIWAVDPSGRHLGTLEFPELPSNLAFGGPRNMTLFVTARTGIYSIRVNVPGRPLFQP
ncbi:MAG: SMP-30/gluconolactonase/LRE family protein [Chloroflexi bacterium]|nr:SMP-30/gluconolactonase/LRE family protein [Chloroflexota bacterium]